MIEVLYDISPAVHQGAGLARYALSSRQGQASLRELAAAAGQREATVLKGLLWLATRGNLTVELGGDALRLGQPGKPDAQNQARYEKEMLFLLEETAAYRAYYLHAEPRDVLRRG